MNKIKMVKRFSLPLVLALVLTLMAVALPATPVMAAELHVGEGQPYATIQDAVDAASAGDTIIVHPGTYEEMVRVDKSVTIQSKEGPDVTVIDSPGIEKCWGHIATIYITMP